jgi:hypothetical protein
MRQKSTASRSYVLLSLSLSLTASTAHIVKVELPRLLENEFSTAGEEPALVSCGDRVIGPRFNFGFSDGCCPRPHPDSAPSLHVPRIARVNTIGKV